MRSARCALALRWNVYWQESPTIRTSVTFRCPCSELFFFMPLSFAASFASSFMLCILALETTPLASMVWPTCFARSTALLARTSQVLPSLEVKRNSLELSPLLRHPMMLLTSPLDLASLSESCATAHAEVRPAKTTHNSKRLNLFVMSFSLICEPREFLTGPYETFVSSDRLRFPGGELPQMPERALPCWLMVRDCDRT